MAHKAFYNKKTKKCTYAYPVRGIDTVPNEQPKKELCIKCGKKPPVFKCELWCSTCYNKLNKPKK